MNIQKHIDYLLLSGIIGGCGLSVSYIAKMSQNIQEMTVSLQILTERLTSTDVMLRDHEMRLRQLEHTNR